MSFDVNVLSTKPMIRETASMQNDGGGGNLGYMEQGNQKKKERQTNESIFGAKDDGDIFSLSSRVPAPVKEEFSFVKFIAEILCSIKNLFVRK